MIFLSLVATAATEAEHVEANCTGEIEFVLPDKTRVDCLLKTHAIEYDWGSKPYEAIGQSLWYAMNTARRAGIVLIIRKEADKRGAMRAKWIIDHYGLPIDLKVIDEIK